MQLNFVVINTVNGIVLARNAIQMDLNLYLFQCLNNTGGYSIPPSLVDVMRFLGMVNISF